MNGLRNRSTREAGSALLLALLVATLLAMLGIALVLIGETESRISANERLSAQALYLAEAAARSVQSWFDDPAGAHGTVVPDPEVVDRSLRRIDEDGDPETPPHPQDGGAWPRYKQGIDRDGDGREDLFDRPYRGSLADTLLGTEAGPDVRIDAADSPRARRFLNRLSRELVGPGGAPPGLEPRVHRIEVYGPPRLPTPGGWVRHGIGTVRVTAGFDAVSRDGGRPVARRTVVAVLNEVPYNAAVFGPLRSCGRLSWSGKLSAGWGSVADAAGASPGSEHRHLPSSWPRSLPAGRELDLLWGWDDDEAFLAYRDALDGDGERLEDPWFRYLSGGRLADAPAGPQPYPFLWSRRGPLSDGSWPNHDHDGEDGTHSNLFQDRPDLGCRGFEYALWKSAATSGARDVHHFVWAGGSSFREDGVGPPRTFRAITDDAEGLFFFDTMDGGPPRDDDGDGDPDNLTPPIGIDGGLWGVRGFVYLNSEILRIGAVAGRPVVFRAPGEPYQDRDQNGRWDPEEPWVNLAYPTRIDGPFVVDTEDTLQDDGTTIGAPVRNRRGPPIPGSAVLWGVLFNRGAFEARGEALYHGSVVAGTVRGQSGGPHGTPRLVWDPRLTDPWPPEGWELPRVTVTRWDTGH